MIKYRWPIIKVMKSLKKIYPSISERNPFILRHLRGMVRHKLQKREKCVDRLEESVHSESNESSSSSGEEVFDHLPQMGDEDPLPSNSRNRLGRWTSKELKYLKLGMTLYGD